MAQQNQAPANTGRSPYKPRGYYRLGTLMSKDRSAAIFHRFDDITALQLLSLQSELFELRSLFEELSRQDDTNTADPEKAALSTSFHKLRENSKGTRYQMLMDMRTKLVEYNDLLIQASQLGALPGPRTRDLDELRHWLFDPQGGNSFRKGVESRMWNRTLPESAFITLKPQIGDADYFTEWLASRIAGVFHRCLGYRCDIGEVIDEESGLRSYNDTRINTVSKIFSTVVSSILPVVTILVLYKIQNTWWRIGSSILFTALFAFFLSIFTEARRVEIFAATATFAAVEVVFIGSALGH